ncbi:hypothetical protein ACUODJ_21695, partial [Escherichia sp. HC-CC]
ANQRNTLPPPQMLKRTRLMKHIKKIKYLSVSILSAIPSMNVEGWLPEEFIWNCIVHNVSMCLIRITAMRVAHPAGKLLK